MSASTKDTIYIDIDDEITSIIDKVQASKHKIVALVLPKRAVTLQSIVNMKLLKRTGEEQGKQIVLITSEASLLPLAGIVGLYTAKTLQSKPVIPKTPNTAIAAETLVDEESAEPEPEIDTSKSVGELAGMAAGAKIALGAVAVEETIDVDNTAEATGVAGKTKSKKDKIKIPNFESFRLRVFLGILALVLLVVAWVFGFVILPKANVVIKTDTTSVTSNVSFTAQTDAKTVDVDKAIIPAVSKDVKKTDALKVPATGTKNVGEKATGTMTLTNCIKDDSTHTVPSGTSFSSGNLNFVTQADVVLPVATFQGSTCRSATVGDSKSVAVTAAQSGGAYNLSARSYTSPFAGIQASGTAMAGGTDKNLTVVSQQDVDGAKAKLVDKSKDAAITELTKALNDAKLVALPQTLTNTEPAITTVPNVGDEAAEVTVTAVTTYSMLGVKHESLEQLITNDVKKQIDINKQPIVDFGLSKMVYNFTSKRSPTDQSLSFQTIATAGTKIDPEALKKEIIGKKKGEVQQIISAHPGVKDVTVEYSPPWVAKIPKKTSRITIVFEQTNKNGK